MKKFLSAFLAFCLIAVLFPTATVRISAETPVYTPETSWYTDYQDELTTFEISMPAQLLGFAKLLQEGNDFSGKTLKLMADIDLNPGWVASVTPTAATNNWNIDGKNHSGKTFQGVFDGQDHTVSGIYYDKYETFHGLFLTGDGATVKNLKVANAAFVATGWRTGVIFGSVKNNNCVIDSVEVASNVYVLHGGTNSGVSTGGLCGMMDGTVSITVKNSVCNAYVSDTNANRGGRAPRIGGLVGDAAKQTVVVENSVFGGDIVVAKGNYACSGLMVGGGFTAPTPDTSDIGEVNNVTVTGSRGLIGTPGAFNAFIASLKHGGFTKGDNHFELTADIDMTGFVVIDGMTGNLPAVSAFSGSLDGKGHTVSNANLTVTHNYDGLLGNAKDATVKNIHFVDCAVTGKTKYGIGGLFGAVLGTTVIENVSADIAVLRTKDRTDLNAVGGLVATVGDKDAADLTLKNCIFTGSVTSQFLEAGDTTDKHGIPRVAGGLVGRVQISGTVCTIDTCAFLGTLIADGDINGGFVGRIDAGTLEILNSYSNGTYDLESKVCSGSFLGQYRDGATVKMSDCVYVETAAVDKPTDGITTGFRAVPATAEVLLNGKKLSGNTSEVGIEKYQYGTKGVRLIGCVDKLDYNTLTLELEITSGGETKTKKVEISTVYQTVLADGVTVTAEELGGNYVFAVVITGLSAGDAFIRVGTATNGTVTEYATFHLDVPAQK